MADQNFNTRNTKKIAEFALAIALSPIIFTGLIKFNEHFRIPEKHIGLPGTEKSSSPQEVLKYTYVGMEKCASVCHNNKDMGFQYDIVRSSSHSNAFKVLLSEKAARYAEYARMEEKPHESPVCLKCHVTGGGLDSSFFASTYRKEDGVTCEACHKGAFITKTFIPKEDDCLKCHNDSAHRMHHFNFKESLSKIDHQRPKARLQNT